MSVIGIWTRGQFEVATAETMIDANSVLLLAGSAEQLRRYDELFCIYHVSSAPVIIIGGGRVGRATARALAEREIDYRIVEMRPERIRDPEKYIDGNAADLATLERAGLRETPAIVITAHDDDQNIYLTIYCRRLRPDVQIISRAVRERNVSTLHRAGADFVLSYAWMGATAIFNYLKRADVLMVAEGLHVCETEVPPALAGKTLAAGGDPARDRLQRRRAAHRGGLQINPARGRGDARRPAHPAHLHAGGGAALPGTLRHAVGATAGFSGSADGVSQTREELYLLFPKKAIRFDARTMAQGLRTTLTQSSFFSLKIA